MPLSRPKALMSLWVSAVSPTIPEAGSPLVFWSARMAAVASKPFMCGMCTSIRMRAWRCFWQACGAPRGGRGWGGVAGPAMPPQGAWEGVCGGVWEAWALRGGVGGVRAGAVEAAWAWQWVRPGVRTCAPFEGGDPPLVGGGAQMKRI